MTGKFFIRHICLAVLITSFPLAAWAGQPVFDTPQERQAEAERETLQNRRKAVRNQQDAVKAAEQEQSEAVKEARQSQREAVREASQDQKDAARRLNAGSPGADETAPTELGPGRANSGDSADMDE